LVDLGPGQRAVIRPHYPHMMVEDTEVWTKFLKSEFVKIKEVWYDVRVGMQVLVGDGSDDVVNRISAGLTRKRIDVVAAVGGGIWVVEVKPYANMYAVGQVMTYVRLFVKEYISPGTVIPVIICDEFDEDLIDELDELGVFVLKND